MTAPQPTSTRPLRQRRLAGHLGSIYRCELERRDVLVSFLRPALEAGSNAALIASPLGAEPVIAALSRETSAGWGRLRWAHAGYPFSRASVHDPGKAAADAVLAVMAAGHREASRVAIDVAFVLDEHPSVRDTLAFVRRITIAIQPTGTVALFLYAAGAFDSEVTLEMFSVHPQLAAESASHDNPYHVPGEPKDRRVFADRLVKTCLQNISTDWTAPAVLDRVVRERASQRQSTDLTEPHFELLVEQSADGVVLVDDSGCVVFLNPAAERLLGRPAESIVGQWFGFPLVAGVPVDIDVLLPDDSTRAVEMHVSEISWHGKRVQLASLRDVSARREIVETLRRAEASFRALIEGFPDAIAVVRNSAVLYVNPACLRLLAYRSTDLLLGRLVIDLVYPDDRPKAQELLDTVRSHHGATAPVELRLLTSTGAVVAFEVVIVPVLFEEQRAFAVVARDVTERKQLVTRLAQADRMASLGTLAAGVAHEINNPLTFVLWNLDNLQASLEAMTDGPPDSAPGDATGSRSAVGLRRIETPRTLAQQAAEAAEGARRIRDVVRSLKSFTKVEEDKPTPVDVNAAMRSALMLAANEIKHRARLQQDLQPVPAVMADFGRISQVLLNLIVNAAQSITEGHAEANTISVRTASDDLEVVIEVADTGAGMTAAVLPRIFDPFFTTKNQGSGSGLGLFVCHNIVAAYGGRIEVDTKPAAGTTFRVRLPVAPNSASVAEPARMPSERAVTGLQARILVVDDEPVVGLVLERIFDGECEVTIAHSGAEAKMVLGVDRAFDVVITDLMMPDVSGMELFDWMERAVPELAPWVVFITGGAFTEEARAFLSRAPGRCVEKPFSPRDVLTLARAMIRQRRAGEHRHGEHGVPTSS